MGYIEPEKKKVTTFFDCQNLFRAAKTLGDCADPTFNFFDTYKNACRYWSGEIKPGSPAPKEIITRLHQRELSVRIIRLISY